MKRHLYVVLEMAVIIAALAFLAERGHSAAGSTNGGFALPNNGPCVPILNSTGFCNDDGIMAVYNSDGIVIHLPVAGRDGTNGRDGLDGRNGVDGKNGIDGKNGTNGKDAVFPQSMLETCPAASGSVPKGWGPTLCAFNLP